MKHLSGQASLLLKKNFWQLHDEREMIREEIEAVLLTHFSAMDLSSLNFPEASSLLLSECMQIFEDDMDPSAAFDVKLWLCRYLSDKYSQNDILQALEIENSIIDHPKIACWASNQYAERALGKFCKLLNEAESILVDGFPHVCDFVNEDNHFGILPIENSVDGRLVGFYRLIDKHELKICAVCDIEDDNGESFTRFALVSGQTHRLPPFYPACIELSITSSDRSSFMELMHSSERLNLTISRMFSVPLYYNRSDAGNDSVTVTVNQKSALPFFIYLYLFGKDINILGIYIQL